jgi:soluble lytic murein transglycosylase
VLGLMTTASAATAQQTRASESAPPLTTSPIVAALGPTDHPRLPLDLSSLWLAPHSSRIQRPALAAALSLFDKGEDAKAFAALSQASVQEGVLGTYALYYAARAQLRLGNPTDAARTFRLIQQREPMGYLREAAAVGEAEALEANGDHKPAADIYQRLSKGRPLAMEDMLMRLGREADAAGDEPRAIEAYLRVYYEFPLSEVAPLAKSRLDGYPNLQRIGAGTQRFDLELGRAQRLFGARMYAPAKSAFEVLRPAAKDDDRDLIDVRIAASDFYLKRYRQARDGAAPFTASGAHRAEALFVHGVASRALGDNAAYLQNVRLIIEKFPDTSWAEEALSNLATQYVRQDDDEAADTVFRELVQRYPRSPFAERAVWKVGWRSFREGRFDETAQLFERAAVDFQRSDYRPAWLFWAGRARQERGDAELAEARYTLVATDYLNSYYGRLAVERLGGRVPQPRVIADPTTLVTASPANDQVVRALLEIERFDDALNELRYAQRQWGESAAVQATVAWILRQQGLAASGREQFNLLRGSINTMRRAYPQFMAAGGEYLPRELLSIIFPVSYWDLIQKHAAANGLDPYFVAALVAQESTFVPDVRSSANAVGLMQLMPSTARTYARKLGLPYSARLMTNPEANIRMGTAYLSDKIREFGDLHLALASYNAGERAVRRWLTERPGLPTDQFIDDIPYPETQNYVKRILGTAQDYRRLYGDAKLPAFKLSANPPLDSDAPVLVSDAVVPVSQLVDAGAVQRVTTITPIKPAPATKRAAKPSGTRAAARKTPAKKTTAPKKPSATARQ